MEIILFLLGLSGIANCILIRMVADFLYYNRDLKREIARLKDELEAEKIASKIPKDIIFNAEGGYRIVESLN